MPKISTIIFTLLLYLWLPNTLMAAMVDAMADEVVSLLQQRALPLRTLDDLNPVLQRCSSRKLILLGDETHGSREFYYMRRVLSLLLVEQQHISFIALEADWNNCRALDRYVRALPGAPSSAEAALQGFNNWRSWVWKNHEMAMLLDQLRTINLKRALEKRVAIYGIDMLDYGNSLEVLSTIPPFSVQSKLLSSCLPAAGMGENDYSAYLLNNGTACNGYATRLGDNLSPAALLFPRMVSAYAFNLARQVSVAQQGEAYFRILARCSECAWNIRINHFTNTLYQLLKRHGPEARGIVWAHNIHVGDARLTSLQQERMESLGQVLRQQMGESQVLLLGQLSFRGTVFSAINWKGKGEILPLPAAAAGSIEDLLHNTGITAGLWLFSPRDSGTALGIPYGQRAVGVSYDPSRDATANYIFAPLIPRYDAIFFIDTTTANAP